MLFQYLFSLHQMPEFYAVKQRPRGSDGQIGKPVTIGTYQRSPEGLRKAEAFIATCRTDETARLARVVARMD